MSAVKCHVCGSLDNILWCSRCHQVAYCGKDHQKSDWKAHKSNCKALAEKFANLKVDGDEKEESSVAGPPRSGSSDKLWSAQNSVPMEQYKEEDVQDKDRALVRSIWASLQQSGLCLLDDFLQKKDAEELLKDVQNMYGAGIFKDGEIVKQGSNLGNERIRSDQITWVDEDYSQCKALEALCKRMDMIVQMCSILGHSKVVSRTKPMVSCYPANSTHYKKHVDNPAEDGRVLTCLYYLNKGWDYKKDGGALIIYPQGLKQKFICEPKFNRVMMFFSDKRNPHEVLPTLKKRFAITCWYFDHDERQRALDRIRRNLTNA